MAMPHDWTRVICGSSSQERLRENRLELLGKAAVALFGKVDAVEHDRNAPAGGVTERHAAERGEIAVERGELSGTADERVALNPCSALHKRRRDEQQRQTADQKIADEDAHPFGSLGRGGAAKQVVRAEHQTEPVCRQPGADLAEQDAHGEAA